MRTPVAETDAEMGPECRNLVRVVLLVELVLLHGDPDPDRLDS